MSAHALPHLSRSRAASLEISDSEVWLACSSACSTVPVAFRVILGCSLPKLVFKIAWFHRHGFCNAPDTASTQLALCHVPVPACSPVAVVEGQACHLSSCVQDWQA